MKPELTNDKYKTALTELRAQLSASQSAQASADSIVELDQAKVGRLSRMDALQTQALNDELQRRRELQLQRIASALDRIDRGEFGICLRCDDDIDARRLDGDPSVTLCVACATAAQG